MARGNGRRMRVNQNPTAPNNDTDNNSNMLVKSVPELLDELDRNAWSHMPPAAKSFLLKKRETHGLHGHIDLTELVKFWTSPVHIKYTKGEVAVTQCGASWYIATQYLKIGMVAEARTVALNGAFFHQCYNMTERAWLIGDYPVRDYDLPLYRRALFASRTPGELKDFLLKGLPQDYQNLMSKFDTLSSNNNRMTYVNQIGDDWGETSSASKKSACKSSTGSQIELFVQDDAKEEERHRFSIDSGTTLKTLFNDYAEKRGISLRLLRFSYDGTTLFLSSVGNKTPDELSMIDQDVISVHGTSAVEEPAINSSTKPSQKANSNSKKFTKKSKGKGGKAKKKKPNKQHQEHGPSPEECKALHSKTLTKLHEEAEPQLKEIRMRLNALDLKRQPRKQKRRKNKKKSKQSNVYTDLQMLPRSGIGGKAGKPFFSIHVGEVSNLYKTTKPSQQQHSTASSTTLDLHGFTQEGALQKLDESLISWVDAAMRGSYPFVIPAKIVCGCGNQVLSEVVEKWIHGNAQVANSPKGQCC